MDDLCVVAFRFVPIIYFPCFQSLLAKLAASCEHFLLYSHDCVVILWSYVYMHETTESVSVSLMSGRGRGVRPRVLRGVAEGGRQREGRRQ